MDKTHKPVEGMTTFVVRFGVNEEFTEVFTDLMQADQFADAMAQAGVPGWTSPSLEEVRWTSTPKARAH
jgi:hypothetical protein